MFRSRRVGATPCHIDLYNTNVLSPPSPSSRRTRLASAGRSSFSTTWMWRLRSWGMRSAFLTSPARRAWRGRLQWEARLLLAWPHPQSAHCSCRSPHWWTVVSPPLRDRSRKWRSSLPFNRHASRGRDAKRVLFLTNAHENSRTPAACMLLLYFRGVIACIAHPRTTRP